MTNDDGGAVAVGGNAFILLLVFVKGRNGITYALCSLIISAKGFLSLWTGDKVFDVIFFYLELFLET